MQIKSFSLKDGGVDIDARTFEGYASTWDKDLVGDIIMPGAFTKSINEAFPAKSRTSFRALVHNFRNRGCDDRFK